VQLLEQLGYSESGGHFRHETRKAVFCGDFIDRGPQIRDVVNIARSMVQNDAALAVLGNHEFNALAFHTPHPEAPGEYLRPHTEKNKRQFQATADQLNPDEMQSALDWFRTLPVALDLQHLRVVHACWDQHSIEQVRQRLNADSRFDAEFMLQATTPGHQLFEHIERVLKGPEAQLPSGVAVRDKDGHPRRRVRIRWFEESEGKTFREYALPANSELPESPAPTAAVPAVYPSDAPPVFVGHYWLPESKPSPLTHNVACLDYSVARGGYLCAYRFDGESRLSQDRFVTVASRHNPGHAAAD
jgi:hypothetical protein